MVRSGKCGAARPVLQCRHGGVDWLPGIGISWWLGESAPSLVRGVAQISWKQHGLLLVKSALVASSWTAAYFSLKHLPISLASLIRSTSPLWTCLLAVAFLQERPTPIQWIGIVLVLLAMQWLARAGKREGIHFFRNRWVYLMVLATLLGTCSALYDKYLLQICKIPASVVQAWFSTYLVLVLLPLLLIWWLLDGRVLGRWLKRFRDWRRTPFEWRFSIPAIGVLLIIADYFYFLAVAFDDSKIAVISPIRRAAVIVSFLAGMILFHEKHWRQKAVCLVLLLIGVVLLSLGS